MSWAKDDGMKYQYDQCDYHASTKNILSNHHRIYIVKANFNSVTLFECNKHGVIVHQQSLHKGTFFTCPQCDHQASHKNSLVDHQQSVHMGRKYQCKQCDFKTTNRGNLSKHRLSVHKGKKCPCPD